MSRGLLRGSALTVPGVRTGSSRALEGEAPSRSAKSGKRQIVRYRRGGRGYRLEHGGTFRRHEVAKERERLIGGWLALGLDPKAELTKLTTEHEHANSPRSDANDWNRVSTSRTNHVELYGTNLDSLDQSPLARADPTRLSSRDIRGQVARWTATGLAANSVREPVSVLRQILDFAEVDPNPARNRTVKLPAGPERELVLPSAAEFSPSRRDSPTSTAFHSCSWSRQL